MLTSRTHGDKHENTSTPKSLRQLHLEPHLSTPPLCLRLDFYPRLSARHESEESDTNPRLSIPLCSHFFGHLHLPTEVCGGYAGLHDTLW